MNKLKDKIWWLILIYLVIGYIFPVILRQRFMLIMFIITIGLIMNESKLSLKEKSRFIAIGTILTAFFLKMIPSPYPLFTEIGLPMAISLTLTMLILFLSLVLAARVSDIILLRIFRAKE